MIMSSAKVEGANKEYFYMVKGIAQKWATEDDLKRTIQDILKANLSTEDIESLIVEVVEITA